MISNKMVMCFLFFLALSLVFQGCVQDKYNKGADNVNFTNIGGFSGSDGQARIRLISYSGEAEIENVKSYADRLGCGMIFAYFYPESTDRNEIPIEELQSARSFVEAREILFKGEGYDKWHFAAQCLGMIPTVTDCQASPISTNCR